MHQHDNRKEFLVKLVFRTLVLAILIYLPLAASAQVTASIVGKITDQKGAVIAGASIVATNESTGFHRSGVSRGDGTYVLDLLPLGSYRVEAELSGFKKMIRRGITLTVRQNARVDLALQVGQVSETVNVNAGAQQVETQEASIAHLMDQRRITELPLVNRNPEQLIGLIPGASNVTTPETGPRDVTVTINGGLSVMNSFQLDGVQFNSVQSNQGLPAPPPDMVQEFRAETNSYDASNGRGAAATFNTITRSGTNNFHGSLFEFHRNSAFNARNYFQAEAPFLVYNQFGGALGGPIVRNRTFFFFGYQGTRVRETTTFSTAFPPTDLERAGNFSQSANSPKDPQTGLTFPGGVIPADRIDAAAANILARLPLPNTPDGRYVYDEPQDSNINQYMARVDHQLTNSDSLTVRTWIDRSNRVRGWGNLPWTRFSEPYNVFNGVVQEMHTFTPSMINQFEIAYNLRDDSRLYSTDFTPQDLGINLPAEQVPFPPQISVTGRFALTVNGEGEPRLEKTWSGKDVVTWIHGRHNLKTGFELEKIRFQGVLNLDNGRFTFSGDSTGNALADFLLGDISTLQFLRERENHSTALMAPFIQDNYHLSRTITLNLGLRYQYEVPIYQVQGQGSTFIPGFQSSRFPNAPLGMAFAGDAGMPNKSSFFPDKNNFAPRLGFAWDILGNGSMSLRGGYGIFYQINNESNVQFTSLNQPFEPTLSLFGIAPLSDPFQNVVLPNVVPGDPIANYNPQTGQATFTLPVPLYAINPHISNGYIQEYSLSLQRQLASGLVVEASYVGNTARKLPVSYEANQAVCTSQPCTLANRQARRIYNPQGLGAITYYDDKGNTWYNSLQTSVRRQFSHGFQLNANYTWSRAIDTLGPFQNPLNTAADKGLSNTDRRNILTVSGVWNLPSLGGEPSLVARLLGNWELSGLLKLTSGSPFTVVSGSDNSLSLVNQDRPNLVADPNLPTDRSRPELIAEYFNTSAFVPNAPLTFGNAGRNILIGPGYADVDIGLMKNIKIRENEHFQLRGEFFNLFNRPNFSNPQATLNSSSFGRILTAGDPRKIQIGLKFQF